MSLDRSICSPIGCGRYCARFEVLDSISQNKKEWLFIALLGIIGEADKRGVMECTEKVVEAFLLADAVYLLF